MLCTLFFLYFPSSPTYCLVLHLFGTHLGFRFQGVHCRGKVLDLARWKFWWLDRGPGGVCLFSKSRSGLCFKILVFTIPLISLMSARSPWLGNVYFLFSPTLGWLLCSYLFLSYYLFFSLALAHITCCSAYLNHAKASGGYLVQLFVSWPC